MWTARWKRAVLLGRRESFAAGWEGTSLLGGRELDSKVGEGCYAEQEKDINDGYAAG